MMRLLARHLILLPFLLTGILSCSTSRKLGSDKPAKERSEEFVRTVRVGERKFEIDNSEI